MELESSHYLQIEDYGAIGDLHTVALVGKNGSIDYLCFPHFDSPTIFGAILDHEKGGYFRLAPVLEEVRHRQQYLPETNILMSHFHSREGIAEVCDFMPVEEKGGHAHQIVRRAKSIRGEIHFRMICAPRFNYGTALHKIEQREDGVYFFSEGADNTVLRLVSEVPVRVENGNVIAEFTLTYPETASFVLEEVESGKATPTKDPDYVDTAFDRTLSFWRGWSRKSTYDGRWREMVNRSALALKLLVSRTHGSIIAAPTFGLPEEIGGQRNWDYRYSWIRDSSFTLYALMRLGYTEEAGNYMNWIQDRCNELDPDGSLQIMYRMDGSHSLVEQELPHWEGYRGSRPVRIGNGAFDQLQLDIYGELMDSVYLYNKYGEPISYAFWQNLVKLLNWVCKNWQQPDEGIWEVRGGKKEFLYSRFMCWVALDRGIRLAHKRSFPAPLDHWLKHRDAIYQDVYENFWDEGLKSFVQYKGSKAVDASCLLMPLVKFIGPTDPHWLSTLNAVEESLVEDTLVYRYNQCHTAASDGLPGSEGSFSMCSFWFVECLSRSGQLDRARLYFEKTLGYANHLGLYAEELGPLGNHLGNFPQAFTHLALISAAFNLDRELDKPR